MTTQTILCLFLVLFSISCAQAYLKKLNNRLAPTAKIRNEIQAKPLQIMQSIIKVKFGRDGTTVATYRPGGRRLIIKNSILYECAGVISRTDGTCSAHLQEMKFAKEEDFCYALSKTMINNWYCLGSGAGSVSAYSINNEFTCGSSDGSPVLLMEGREYHRVCTKLARTVKYKYYTWSPLQYFSRWLDCHGHKPQICRYNETLARMGRQVIRHGNAVIINKK